MGVLYKEIFKRFHQQVAVFLAVLGPDACEICDNLKFEAPDDKNDFSLDIYARTWPKST